MSIRVLLADDHVLMREGLRVLLEQAPGVRVVAEAGDGRQAVALARQRLPNVVLMDISMPFLNGIEATRQIRQEMPHVRVACLSMHAERQTLAAALSAGATGYVLKDCAGTDLVTAVNVVAGGQCYLSPGVTDEVVKGYVRLQTIDGTSSAFSQLSDREREVLQLLSEGYRTREVARSLCVSIKTVCSHRAHIMQKLNLRGNADLVKYALSEGLITA